MYNIYLISSEINGKKLHKIGFTRRPVNKRLNEFKTGNASQFEIVKTFESKWGTKIEAQLHKIFQSYKIRGEWFDLTKEHCDTFIQHCQKIHDNLELISKENSYYSHRGDF